MKHLMLLCCVFLTAGILLTCSRFPDYEIDELLTAPEQVEIDNREFILETAIFRSFMPICPPDGDPMFARIWVVATDSLPFPSSLDADFLWVINDAHDVWVTDFEEEYTTIDDFKLEKVAVDGPKWDTFPSPVLVDAIVQLKDGAGNTYLLRAADQVVYVIW
ncbi:MAG: hypothetical protein OEV79_11990 [candidate division WOR-3 bacterium]|nr:hypothetical protein [candidate division WOR-3 bacterium]